MKTFDYWNLTSEKYYSEIEPHIRHNHQKKSLYSYIYKDETEVLYSFLPGFKKTPIIFFPCSDSGFRILFYSEYIPKNLLLISDSKGYYCSHLPDILLNLRTNLSNKFSLSKDKEKKELVLVPKGVKILQYSQFYCFNKNAIYSTVETKGRKDSKRSNYKFYKPFRICSLYFPKIKEIAEIKCYISKKTKYDEYTYLSYNDSCSFQKDRKEQESDSLANNK